jgi:hypothetical protein
MRNLLVPIGLSAALAVQAAPPQRVEIVYDLARNGTSLAEVTERLEHDRHEYKVEESWKGKGIFALRGDARRMSRGAIAKDGLRPAEFEDRRPGRDPVRAEFDAQAPGAALERQDRLSFVWNFVFFPPKGEVTVKVADGRGVSTQVFRAAGKERIRVPAGEFDALKVVRKGDRPTELWLATDRSNLPVKIVVIEKDGTRLEQTAVRIAAQ